MPLDMNVAVLSKKPLATHRYDQWLAGRDLVLFAEDTEAAREFLASGAHEFAPGAVRLFPDWKTNRAVDEALLASHALRPFDRIVALSECDLLRAAELRERLGLPGQGVASARAFRDKTVMKEHARATGLAVPDFRSVSSVHDLTDFAAAHRNQVIIKPADGSGSAGVRLLEDVKAVEAWIDAAALSCDSPAGYLAEEFIGAPMLSADGLMTDGEVVTVMVGEYTRTCLSSLTELRPHGILLLDPGDPRASAARAYLRDLLRALPAAGGTMSFHCELFDDAARGPMLCEIAARSGGGFLPDIARRVLGVDLERAAALGQAGTDTTTARTDAGPRYGDILVPRSHRYLPDGLTCDLPGVVTFAARRSQMTPDQCRPAAKISDYVVSALLLSGSNAGLRRIYDDVAAWLSENMRAGDGS